MNPCGSSGTPLEASRLQNLEGPYLDLILFMCLRRLADVWCHLDAHWILKGSPNRICGHRSESNEKHGVLDPVLKKHGFAIGLRCQNERPEVVKVMFLHDACCNLRGLGGGYEI